MADKASNVVLNFKMDGQVEYAKTVKDINAVMNVAAKEYRNHVAEMGKDATATEKLAAEKKKLEIQMKAASERTKLLSDEYKAMSENTNATTAQLTGLYGKLLDSEKAEGSLADSMDRVNDGMSEQAEAGRKSEEALKELSAESDKLGGSASKLNAEYELQKAVLGENADESDKLALTMDHLNKSHDIAGEKVSNYEQQLEEAKQQYGENSEEIDKYEIQLLEARKTEAELSTEIDKTSEAMTAHAIATSDSAQGLDTLKTSEEGLTSASERLNKEYELQKVQLGNNATEAEKLALEMGHLNDTHEVAKEKVANYEQQLALAKEQYGENSEEVRAYEDGLLEARTAEQSLANEVEVTSEALREQNDAFKNAVDNVEKFGDSAKKVGGAMTKYITGPIVAGAGGLIALATAAGSTADRLLDLRDISGLTTDSIQEWQFVSQVAGVEQEALTKTMEGFIKKLPQLEEEGGKATEALNKLGFSYSDLKDASPDEQIDMLMYSLGEMENPLERNAVGAQLFGGAWKDIAPILGMGADAMKETREEAHELGTVLSEDSLNSANDFRIEMDKMKASLAGVFHQIGADLAPMISDTLIPLLRDHAVPILKTFGEVVEVLVKAFSNLSPFMQKMILGFTALMAALGPVIFVIGAIAGAFVNIARVVGPVIGILSKLGPAFTAIKVAIVAMTAPLTGTVLAIAAVVAAVVALTVIVYKNWDAIWKFTKDVFGMIGEIIAFTFQFIYDNTIGQIAKLSKYIVENWDAIFEKTKAIFTAIGKFISEVWKKAFDFTKKLIFDYVGAVVKFWSDLFNNTKKVFNLIIDFIINIWKKSIDGTMKIIKKLVDGIMDKFNSLKNGVSKIFNSVKDAITKPINLARDAVKKAIDAIKGFFDFKFKWPELKVPKFETSGSFNPAKWASEGPPKVKVKWNAKGGIFNKPTIFGKSGGEYQGAGEVPGESEAVLPLNAKTLGGIGKGIAEAMGGTTGGGDLHLTIEVPIDGETVARKTIKYTMREMYAAQQKDKRGRR